MEEVTLGGGQTQEEHNGGGYRRRNGTGGVPRGPKGPKVLGTHSQACMQNLIYFLADRTTTVLCGRPGPLGHFSSARRHSACMHGVVGCLRPAVRTP